MSQPAVTALAPPTLDFEIVYSDGEPLESHWHVQQMHFLNDLLWQVVREQRRTDVFFGANQFVYYSVEQAREVAELVAKGRKLKFRGPDVFWVNDVMPKAERPAWIAWEEGGRLPDVIFELLSKSNSLRHQKEKKELYSRVFKTAEYFIYGPPRFVLEGFRLAGGAYRPIAPDPAGRLWSEQLRCFVGLWHGSYQDLETTWVRLYRQDGSLISSPWELADEERSRAEAAEAELARLRALLDRQS
ncbi:MAG TPA: Uma2 family endonuclease [Thermoanaerobaculia bacterium]|nr:Uma2 family endonuclease [Thermoanaerobaculia bacterium]